MKILSLLLVIVLFIMMFPLVENLPQFGDPNQISNQKVSKYYLEHTLEVNDVPNVVTAVLADYRAFDTMFETAVVFIAGLAIIFILRRPRRRKNKNGYVYEKLVDHVGYQPNIIVQTTCRIFVPIMQLFALYVLAHGHHSPGGGFQGGVILGSMLILLAVCFNLRIMLQKFSIRKHILYSAIGVLIFFMFGFLAIFFGKNFLDYTYLNTILGLTDKESRSLGILFVETGVAVAVMSVMFTIYANLRTSGRINTAEQ